MKTHACLALIAAALFTFSSCKKDYTCTCTYKYSPTSPLQSGSVVYEESTRGDAKDACDQNKSDILNDGGIDVECKIN